MRKHETAPAMRRFDGPLHRRQRIAAAGVLLAGLVLIIRIVFLQGVRNPEFSESAAGQQVVSEVLSPQPGEIVDRNGRVLATSILTRSLWVNPRRVADPHRFAAKLSTVLAIDSATLEQRIRDARRKRFLWVKRRLSADEAKAVRRLQLPADAWGFRDEYLRRYPQGPVAAHVLGLRDVDGKGRGGIEQMFDSRLRGVPGKRLAVRDARGRILDVDADAARPPQHGRTVQLTLDVLLQFEVEREIDELMTTWKPKGAGVIVMDPQTGEILAMASRPAFNPNDPRDVPPAAWKNVNVASVFEPGSTFKPFVVAWALQKQAVSRTETFHCENGEYRMGRRVLHDHHPYGRLSVKDILVKSSNIGMAKIGRRLGNRGLYQAAVRFGFGRRTGCGLPGEVDGILRPLKQWNDYSTGSIPMGQELAVTPLQLITAHAALANGGKLISPRIVKRVGDASASAEPASRTPVEDASPQVVSRTVEPEIAAWIVRDVMVDVVRRGTGKRAKLAGYTVFGKTGTAQKIDPRTGRYSKSRLVCSFLAGAPAKNPRAVVLVVVDEPTAPGVHFGGTVAAPTAARVLRKTLLRQRVPRQAAETRMSKIK